MMFLMLVKSKVAYFGIGMLILSEDSPSAWKLFISQWEACPGMFDEVLGGLCSLEVFIP